MRTFALILIVVLALAPCVYGDAPQTLFNVSPISISTDGLTEEEATFAHALEESVNAVCNASTLTEITDVWRCGKGKHYLSIDEINLIRKNEIEALYDELDGATSYNEYQPKRNKTSGKLFGESRTRPGDFSYFEGFAVTSRRAIADTILLVNTNGYIELRLRLDPQSAKKIIEELYFVEFDKREGRLFQFHPNGVVKRCVQIRYPNPKWLISYDVRPIDRSEIAKEDYDPYVDLICDGVQSYFEEPVETFGLAMKWDDSGRMQERRENAAPEPFESATSTDAVAAIAPSASECVVPICNPLFIANEIKVPNDGFYDQYDKDVLTEIAQTIESFGRFQSSEERTTRLNELSKAVFGARDDGSVRLFTAAYFSESHNEWNVELFCEKGLILATFGGAESIIKDNAISAPCARKGYIRQIIVVAPEKEGTLYFELNADGSKEYCWFASSGSHFAANVVLRSDEPNIRKLYEDPSLDEETRKKLKDKHTRADLLLIKTRVSWKSDGSVKERQFFDKPTPLPSPGY